MDEIIIIIVVLTVLVLLFLVFREIVMWYWKVNRRVELMEQQNELLKKILSRIGGESTNNDSSGNHDLDSLSLSQYEKECERIQGLINEARTTGLKNKDFLRGVILTLSMNKQYEEILKCYKEINNIDLFDDIKSIDVDSKRINYVLEPFIKSGIVSKKI